MSTKMKPHTQRPQETPAPEVGALDPAPAAAPETAAVGWEQRAHRGDWLAFFLWIGCVLLVTAMNVYDLILGLFH